MAENDAVVSGSESQTATVTGADLETAVVTGAESQTAPVTGAKTATETAVNAKVVEHKVAEYEATDNPETHMLSAEVPKFCLKPKNERSTYSYTCIIIHS